MDLSCRAMGKLLIYAAGSGLVLLLLGLLAWSAHLNREAERRFPATGAFIEVENLRLHYTDSGGGRTIVLVHGANSALQDWESGVRQTLQRTFRVIAFDRPGHGYSERHWDRAPTPAEQARLLRFALRQLGVERPILVGFSWSGSLVMAYGLDYPDEVAAVVTVAGALYDWPSPIGAIYQIAGWPVLGSFLAHAIVPAYAHAFADELSRDVFAPQPLGDSLGRAPVPLAVRPASFLTNAEERRILKPFLALQKTRYGEFRPPLVVLTGTADRVVSPDIHSRALARTAPQAELIEIAGAGHALPYTHPQRIVDAVLRAHVRAQAIGRIPY
ncbi:MAG: alpha/beta hydrolase [Alphaproteobacteria bacterium]|nr:alpha/beta hydrolase [Alphaproteobacteria bacterium]